MNTSKHFKSIVSAFILLAAAAQATPSQAFIAAGTANPVLGIVSIVLLGAGGVSVIAAGANNKSKTPGILTILAGWILFDNSNGSIRSSYSELTSEQAHALGLSDDELAAYTDELPQLNLLRETVTRRMMARFAGQKQIDPNELRDASESEWQNVSSALSPEAYSGLQKIRHQVPQA